MLLDYSLLNREITGSEAREHGKLFLFNKTVLIDAFNNQEKHSILATELVDTIKRIERARPLQGETILFTV